MELLRILAPFVAIILLIRFITSLQQSMSADEQPTPDATTVASIKKTVVGKMLQLSRVNGFPRLYELDDFLGRIFNNHGVEIYTVHADTDGQILDRGTEFYHHTNVLGYHTDGRTFAKVWRYNRAYQPIDPPMEILA